MCGSEFLLNYVLCRFVLDTCKRLKEKKSYLVWTAVGCLGVSALSDLVKEVILSSNLVFMRVGENRTFLAYFVCEPKCCRLLKGS